MLNTLLDEFVAERIQFEKDEMNATYDMLLQYLKISDKFVAERTQLENDEMNASTLTTCSCMTFEGDGIIGMLNKLFGKYVAERTQFEL